MGQFLLGLVNLLADCIFAFEELAIGRMVARHSLVDIDWFCVGCLDLLVCDGDKQLVIDDDGSSSHSVIRRVCGFFYSRSVATVARMQIWDAAEVFDRGSPKTKKQIRWLCQKQYAIVDMSIHWNPRPR